MKKTRIWTTLVLLAIAVAIWAIPAAPGAVKVQQPDGSYVTILLHGDEWQSFNTTEDGYSVVKDDKGFYVYAQLEKGLLKATKMIAHDAQQRQASEQAFLSGMTKYQRSAMAPEVAEMKQMVEQGEARKLAARRAGNKGNRAAQYDYNNFRGLVILIEYNDKSFSREDYADIIKDMFNQENYTGFYNGTKKQVYTGSVRDYFSDNSLGKFQPQFDIYGPYKINYSQYSANKTSGATPILNAAINAADADINFKDYDRDNDGYVDMIYFVLAGNGSNFGGNDQRLWWPHRSVLVTENRYFLRKDNVTLWDYASSVELTGYTSTPSSVMIDGIGTVCHEFSHVLGLPDFYDTDYKDNGQSNDPGDWSVMAGGSYMNNSRTPVGYSLYERWSVGFCDAPETIAAKGSCTLEALHKNQKGFLLPTPLEDEFFLMENRQKTAFKWDAYLPGSGMLVHRVEFSDPSIWSLGSFKNNIVNAYAAHNYYELVRANGAHTSGGAYTASADDVFPAKNKTSLTNETSPANLKTWNGTPNEWAITNIRMSNGVVTFDVGNYEVSSLAIEPAAIDELPVGVSKLLKAIVTPSYATNQLTWSSDAPAIATIDENGLVKGISEGTTTIRLLSDNFVEATCQVTVKNVPVYTIAEFKKQQAGNTALLNLTNAEVLYVYQNDAYVRDDTGCIILDNSVLGLKKNDRIVGTVMAQVGVRNKMPLAMSTEGTSIENLYITAGSEVQPREVFIDELSENDYCDYVLVKAGKLKAEGGVWIVNSNNEKKARLWNMFKIANISLKNYDGNYYDIPAIYGTDVLDSEVINELYMLKTPTKVTPPTGIADVIRPTSNDATKPMYNMNGQRVANDYKGLVIVGGKKVLKK